MSKKLKLILINCSILLIGILLIELFFGGWFSSSNQLSNLGIIKDAKFEFDVDHLYDTENPTITYSRDKFGLRGISSFDQPSTIDILTVGGSTTDQRYIDDSKTWQEVLERQIKDAGDTMNVSNAGVDGQSTYGHLKSFELWFSKIEKLQPEMILFYVGINDFYRVSSDSQYDNFEAIESRSIKSQIRDKSVVYNVYRKLKGIRKAKKHNVGHHKIDFSSKKYTTQEILDEKLIELYSTKNLQAFKSRLEKLIAYSEKMGAIPIFITQPTFLYQLRNGEVFGVEELNYLEESYAYNGVGYYTLLNKLNAVIKEVVREEQVIDLTNDSDWEADDFYDYYHTTEAGAAKLGKKIYDRLQNGFVK